MRLLNCGTLLLGLALVGASTAFAADPTLHEVYQQVESGNLGQAKSMMDDVLRNHPNSAKAHFVDAEILAKQGNLESARAELATAERLDASLSFAKLEAVRELNQRIAVHAGSRSVSPLASSQPSSGFDLRWVLLLGLIFVVAVVLFRRRLFPSPMAQQAAVNGPSGPGTYYPNGTPAPMGAPGGYGMQPAPSGGMGSSLLGGLATGAAVGAGVVAGEMLMHKMLDGGHHGEALAAQPTELPFQDPTYDAGGQDFGVSDSGSWDDGGGGGGGDWN